MDPGSTRRRLPRTRSRLGRHWRWAVVAVLPLLLGGCGCHLQSRDARCQALIGGMLVAAAPVALVSAAGERIGDRSADRAQQRLVEAGDPQAIGRCVLMCNTYHHLDGDTRVALIATSADWILTHWDAAPEPAQLPALMRAHIVRGHAVLGDDPDRAHRHWLRAARLAADPDMAGALETRDYGAAGYNRGYYDRQAVELQTALLLLRHRGRPGRAADPTALDGDCRPEGAWPPAWASAHARQALMERACASASRRAFGPGHRPLLERAQVSRLSVDEDPADQAPADDAD